MLFNRKFILASSSKSRAFLLKNNNLNFIQIKPKCNEQNIKKKLIKSKKSIKKIPLELAKAKAQSIGLKRNLITVGADTIILFENKIIDKAKNLKQAITKIKKLSGKEHLIISSACAFYKSKLLWKHTETTKVRIRKLNDKEIEHYLKKSGKQILNSVGCYQIEKNGLNIIETIKGDFFNVMGFPLFNFINFLKKNDN